MGSNSNETVEVQTPLRISIISDNFPHPKFPQSGAFVHKIADSWAASGENVTVYAPISRTHMLLRRRESPVEIIFHNNLDVRYLGFFSFSNYKIFGFNTSAIGFRNAHRKLDDELRKDIEAMNGPDVLYGKFLLTGGQHSAELSAKYGIPAFVDIGESVLLETLTKKERLTAKEIIRKLSGAICVSPRLEREIIELGMEPSKVLMIPNAVDTRKFFPIDQLTARETLLLPKDKKIVIFVGHFIPRKGPDRVLKAVEQLPEEYCCVFLGEGHIQLKSSRVLFKGRVSNEQLNTWLNAADIFCLPTLAEGSCNAIEEARAVGLPIVTSNIPDITDFKSSRDYKLVNPMSISDIAEGIRQACEKIKSEYREKPMDNTARSMKILYWIKTNVNNSRM